MTDPRRIARIIRLRERLRDIAQGELSHAESLRARAEQRVDAAREELAEISAEYLIGGEIVARELAHRASLVDSARRLEEAAQDELRLAAEEREQRATALGDAQRDVRSLEVVAGRLDERARKAAGAKEQTESDAHGARLSRVG